jgi:hypothetical protein
MQQLANARRKSSEATFDISLRARGSSGWRSARGRISAGGLGARGGDDLGGSGLGVGDDRLSSAARGIDHIMRLALRLHARLADLILDGVEVGLDRFDARLQPLLLRFRRLAPLVELLE